MYTITNPTTGKSMQAWEGTQYTPGGAISTVHTIGGLKTPEQVRQEVMAGRVSRSSGGGGSSGGGKSTSTTSSKSGSNGSSSSWNWGATLGAIGAGLGLAGLGAGLAGSSPAVGAALGTLGTGLSTVAGYRGGSGTVGRQPTTTLPPDIQRQLDEQKKIYEGYINQLNNQLDALRSQFQVTPPPKLEVTSPPTPVKIEQPPKIEVPAGQKPAETSGPAQDVQEKGPGGFVEQVALPTAAVPSVDELYRIYKEVTGGKESPEIREYLASPQFQSVLGGKVPMWMSADPVWRLYLMRLGYLPGRGNRARMDALRERVQQAG
ncbi:hypothetical protein [Neomoorella mulderi]|nr:hypothetical protein [Moorella mulderi]